MVKGDLMKILSEKKKIYYDTKMEFSDDEIANLLSYAHKNMPMEVLNDFYIEWAVIDILKREVERHKEHKKFLEEMKSFAKEQQKKNRKDYRKGKMAKDGRGFK
jgi:hypothetical protein